MNKQHYIYTPHTPVFAKFKVRNVTPCMNVMEMVKLGIPKIKGDVQRDVT